MASAPTVVVELIYLSFRDGPQPFFAEILSGCRAVISACFPVIVPFTTASPPDGRDASSWESSITKRSNVVVA